MTKARWTTDGESARIFWLKNFKGGNCAPPPASYAYVTNINNMANAV